MGPAPGARRPAPAAATPMVAQAPASVPGASDDLSARIDALEKVAKKVRHCRLCTELAAGRTQTVFGVGSPLTRLVFLGEAPGADEDRQGEPFVGEAGQLLNKIIGACGWKREEVYILNILKCRPPGNRTPSPAEASNCRPFLDAQLRILRPQFICCLGATASTNLLGIRAPIGQFRGHVYEYEGAKVICTYHPAYLLRYPPAKAEVWADMKFLMKEMGVTPPSTKK